VGAYGRGYAAGGYAYSYHSDPRLSLALDGQKRAQIRTQERIRGNASANAIMEGLQAEMAHMRVVLTGKYGVEF
jgi:hypothetical protein